VLGKDKMKLSLVLALLALLIVTSLGLGYLYLDTNRRLSDLEYISNNQITRINELESMLGSSHEAWELVNITKSFGSGYNMAHISLMGFYDSIYGEIVNVSITKSGYQHQNEYSLIYSPRDNMTLRITADLHESIRNIPIEIFDMSAYKTQAPIYSLEAKPDAYNEFKVVLPVKGWYDVSSYREWFYSDPKYDYSLHVAMQLNDGTSFIPFVIRK
jgi:hypothetical protein